MDVGTGGTQGITFEIPAEHREAAARYIAEIARRDALAKLGPEFEAERAGELWETFVATYRSVSTGPYAKRGTDAIRVALGRL
jgi:hypothetical protein